MNLQEKIDLEYGGLPQNDLIEKINSSGILLNEYAKTILFSNFFKTSNKTQKITVIKMTIKDLGFPEGATIPQIGRIIKSFGLSECPLEVAPYLRLKLKKQKEIKQEIKNKTPEGSLTVFSKYNVEDDNFPKGFYLRKISGKLWLRGYCCSLDYTWSPDDQLVFKLNN